MRSKKMKNLTVVFFAIFAILLILPIMIMMIPRINIELKGNKKEVLEVGSKYKDKGANAFISNLFTKKSIEVRTAGEVDSNKVGTYKITYEAKDNGQSKLVTREIQVVDKTKPTIKINKISACQNNKTFDFDVEVTDNYDGDLKDKLKYQVEDEKIIFNVSDEAGNTTEIEGELKYIDDEKPVITIKGNSTINLRKGDEYIDAGATASDSCDGDLTKKIKTDNKVNTNEVGSYEVVYTVEDNNGNKTTKSRKVVVSEETIEGNGTIYLTFDDGPGKYTSQILDTLDKYNIKATFFVTSQFPGYLDKIKDEYDRGHTVGVHTYSHKWSIYNAVDSYWNDFSSMENIVYEKTGVHPKYFRFPGGTSNTANCKYNDSNNMMETLTNLMTEKGYVYFDWHVDSCDTCKKNSVNDIINTIKKYVKGSGNYIILMHDIKKNTMEALPSVIEYLKAHNYTFKKIDDTTPVKQFGPGVCKKN